MRVKDFMQTKVISVPSSTSLYDARKIMVENKIKRIPIVDNGKLVGVTSLNKIREASPSEATTLSIHELHYLISKMTVKDIMHKDIVTCHPDDPVEEVAMVMHVRQIGAMPVINENRELVGYVSSNDLFKLVVMILGLDRPLSRITVQFPLKDVCTQLDRLIAILDKHKLCIRSLARFDRNDMICDVVIRVDAAEVSGFVAEAVKEGFKVGSFLTGKKEVKI
jgi:acetoin utilization protein AcuB